MNMLGAMEEAIEQSGGELLGQGMYGCVFTSSLLCKNKKTPDKKDREEPLLSKLIERSQAEIEYTISNLIRQIPIWKNYFAVSESICEPATKQVEKDIKHCEVLEDKSISDFRILSIGHQGITLDAVRINMATFDVMKFISHLMEAGALMTLFGIVHRDLHRGNIVVDPHNVPRIIDFNLSMLAKDSISEEDLIHRHTVLLGQEPPDATIVNATSQGHDGIQVIESIIRRKPILKNIQSLLGVSEQSMKISLNRFYQKSKSMKEGDSVSWFKTYWRTYDSWGIGVNIIVLLIKLSIWPNFKIDTYKNKLFPILRKMCAVSPTERIDCVQALYQLNPTHFILQRYGKEWLKKVGTGI